MWGSLLLENTTSCRMCCFLVKASGVSVAEHSYLAWGRLPKPLSPTVVMGCSTPVTYSYTKQQDLNGAKVVVAVGCSTASLPHGFAAYPLLPKGL